MASPLAVVERNRCIAELKRANRQSQPGVITMIPLLYLGVMNSLPIFLRFPDDGLPPIVLKLYILILVVIVFFALILYCSIYTMTVKLIYVYAANVFSQTDLVSHVLALPSDNQAYRGWWRAVLAGKPLSFKRERYDACRRVKAIVVCFNAWSKCFGAAPPPWITRLVPHQSLFFLLIAAWGSAGNFIFERIGLDFASSVDHPAAFDFRFIWINIFMYGFTILAAPLFAIVIGRHVACRKALIDYFEAEAVSLRSAEVATTEAARAHAALVASAEAKLLPKSQDA